MFLEFISTEVLVIGGGAGLCAAISARKEGAEVLLVSKSLPGRLTIRLSEEEPSLLPPGYGTNVIHLNSILQDILAVKPLTYNEAKVIVIEKVYLKCIL